MNKLILSALLCCFSSATFASENKFGIDLLNSLSSVACDNADEVVTNPLWQRTCNKSAVGYRLSYIVNLKPTYQIEVAYLDFGKVEWSGHFTGFPNEQVQSIISNETVKFGASAIEVLGRKDFELSPEWNLNVYGGLSSTKMKYDSTAYSEHLEIAGSGRTIRNTGSDSSISPILGVGLSFEHILVALKIHTNLDTGQADKSNILSFALGVRF